MTPEQARARAKAILDAQKSGQVIQLNSDGTLSSPREPAFLGWGGKKTVLNDPKGEYGLQFAVDNSAEYARSTGHWEWRSTVIDLPRIDNCVTCGFDPSDGPCGA
jgi:hypothetical protein